MDEVYLQKIKEFNIQVIIVLTQAIDSKKADILKDNILSDIDTRQLVQEKNGHYQRLLLLLQLILDILPKLLILVKIKKF